MHLHSSLPEKKSFHNFKVEIQESSNIPDNDVKQENDAYDSYDYGIEEMVILDFFEYLQKNCKGKKIIIVVFKENE